MVDATLCFLIRGDPPAEILLGYKKVGFGRGKWGGLGGKVQPGETVAAAAVREMEEETGIRVPQSEVHQVACLTFVFPHRPAWSQVVHVFVALAWDGDAVESDEMRPVWFRVDEIPYAQMWDDGRYWLPLVLEGRRFEARFRFGADNETVERVEFEAWQDAGAEVSSLPRRQWRFHDR